MSAFLMSTIKRQKVYLTTSHTMALRKRKDLQKTTFTTNKVVWVGLKSLDVNILGERMINRNWYLFPELLETCFKENFKI